MRFLNASLFGRAGLPGSPPSHRRKRDGGVIPLYESCFCPTVLMLTTTGIPLFIIPADAMQPVYCVGGACSIKYTAYTAGGRSCSGQSCQKRGEYVCDYDLTALRDAQSAAFRADTDWFPEQYIAPEAVSDSGAAYYLRGYNTGESANPHGDSTQMYHLCSMRTMSRWATRCWAELPDARSGARRSSLSQIQAVDGGRDTPKVDAGCLVRRRTACYTFQSGVCRSAPGKREV